MLTDYSAGERGRASADNGLRYARADEAGSRTAQGGGCANLCPNRCWPLSLSGYLLVLGRRSAASSITFSPSFTVIIIDQSFPQEIRSVVSDVSEKYEQQLTDQYELYDRKCQELREEVRGGAVLFSHRVDVLLIVLCLLLLSRSLLSCLLSVSLFSLAPRSKRPAKRTAKPLRPKRSVQHSLLSLLLQSVCSLCCNPLFNQVLYSAAVACSLSCT
jgi:hypothetical protein